MRICTDKPRNAGTKIINLFLTDKKWKTHVIWILVHMDKIGRIKKNTVMIHICYFKIIEIIFLKPPKTLIDHCHF